MDIRVTEKVSVSAPIALVVEGLLIGSYGRRYAMSESTCQHLDTFWGLVDEILNAVLFVLIGLEVLIICYTSEQFIAGLIAIPIVLLARLISVGLPMACTRSMQSFAPRTVRVLT